VEYYLKTSDEDPVNRHKPSVDVLFESAAKLGSRNLTAIILTGMGADGAKGMLKIFEAGGKTVAQDEESSIVFGMPKKAIETGGVQHIVPLDEVAKKLLELTNFDKRKRSA
jgi:two-component system, chemotaxis family, protein-glutamate methylesterase/glutaminase